MSNFIDNIKIILLTIFVILVGLIILIAIPIILAIITILIIALFCYFYIKTNKKHIDIDID